MLKNENYQRQPATKPFLQKRSLIEILSDVVTSRRIILNLKYISRSCVCYYFAVLFPFFWASLLKRPIPRLSALAAACLRKWIYSGTSMHSNLIRMRTRLAPSLDEIVTLRARAKSRPQLRIINNWHTFIRIHFVSRCRFISGRADMSVRKESAESSSRRELI